VRKNAKIFNVLLRPDERQKLDWLAQESGLSRGQVVRFLIKIAQPHDLVSLAIDDDRLDNRVVRTAY
jgi:hypothetical protein